MAKLIELTDVWARRKAMGEDPGATSLNRDDLARSFNGKLVRAVGTVDDVLGHRSDLVVRLVIGEETLECPLVRVHGRSMEETILEVGRWRRGDVVEVTGKLVWDLFTAEPAIEVLTAAPAPAAG